MLRSIKSRTTYLKIVASLSILAYYSRRRRVISAGRSSDLDYRRVTIGGLLEILNRLNAI